MKITTIYNYVDILHEQFPEFSKATIIKILKYGFKRYQAITGYGGDFLCVCKNTKVYSGKIYNNPIKACKYYTLKLSSKIRTLFKIKKFRWNYYYYFSLSEHEYQRYLKRKNNRVELFSFRNIWLYKLRDDCIVNALGRRYIFRMRFNWDIGVRIYKELFTTNKAKLHMMFSHPLRFKDILTDSYNYNILHGTRDNQHLF